MQIIATLGPASQAPATQRSLAAVADRFRLNTSHLDPAGLSRWLTQLAQRFDELGHVLPVVVDLQGAKMRVGALPQPLPLAGHVVFTLDAASGRPAAAPAGAPLVPVGHPALYAAVEPGEQLTLDDARLAVSVERVFRSELEQGRAWIIARVSSAGLLRANKGINRPDHPLPCEALSARDRAMIAVAKRYDFTELAFSFVHDGREARLLGAAAGAQRTIAKIERPEAFAHLSAIAAGFDELWLCRGDLGSQAGLLALGSLQARFAETIPSLGRPALLAGQVLEHLTRHPEPTRAEVVQLHDAERVGFSGFVLSDETAIGDHVDHVVAFLEAWRGRAPARD